MALTRISLIFRASHGDEASWKNLTELYRPLLLNWLRHHGVPTQDVDDVTQDILLSLVKSLPSFEHNGNQGAFRTWLRTIVVKRVMDYRRASLGRLRDLDRAREAGLSLHGEQGAASRSELERLWDREHDHYVVRCVVELVRTQFEPLTFRAFSRQVFDGVRPSQVAEELGLSLASVYAAKSRVMRLVRQQAEGLIA